MKGVVIDLSNGSILDAVRVSVFSGGEPHTLSDSAGAYELHVSPGTVRLRYEKMSYQPEREYCELLAHESKDTEVNPDFGLYYLQGDIVYYQSMSQNMQQSGASPEYVWTQSGQAGMPLVSRASMAAAFVETFKASDLKRIKGLKPFLNVSAKVLVRAAKEVTTSVKQGTELSSLRSNWSKIGDEAKAELLANFARDRTLNAEQKKAFFEVNRNRLSPELREDAIGREPKR